MRIRVLSSEVFSSNALEAWMNQNCLGILIGTLQFLAGFELSEGGVLGSRYKGVYGRESFSAMALIMGAKPVMAAPSSSAHRKGRISFR